jgi:hypothetical protein
MPKFYHLQANAKILPHLSKIIFKRKQHTEGQSLLAQRQLPIFLYCTLSLNVYVRAGARARTVESKLTTKKEYYFNNFNANSKATYKRLFK